MSRLWTRSTAIACATGAIIALVLVTGRHESEAASPQQGPVNELRELLVRGQYAQADAGAQQALAKLQAEGRGATLDAAELLDILVAARSRSGKAQQDDVVRSAEQAIEIKTRLAGPRDPAVATSLDNAGVLFFIRGDYQRALGLYERALAIWQSHATDDSRAGIELGKVHSHLGPLFQELGQYSTARDHYEQALRAFLASADRDDGQIAMTRNNLATLMTKIGDYEEALTLYAESLASLERLRGPEHPLIANGRHNLAEVNQRMGRESQAIELYRQSVALKEKTLGSSHPSLALTLGNLSYLHADRGEGAQAEELARRAVQIHTNANGVQHVDLAYSLVSLGRALAVRGDLDGARTALTQAIDLRTTALGADNPLLVLPMFFLGDVLARDGEPDAAFDLLLRAESIGREHLRLTARGSPERQALRYAVERPASLDAALTLALTRNDPATLRRAWDALIHSRAVVLDEVATRQRLAVSERNASLRDALHAYRTAAEELSNTLLRGPDSRGLEPYRQRIGTLRRDKEVAERRLAAASDTARDRLAEQEIGYDSVSAALPDNAMLVAFARIGAPTRADARAIQYAAFVLRNQGEAPRIVRLGSAPDIETAIRRWRDELTSDALQTDRRRYAEAGGRLRQLLWDPLQIEAGDERLVLVVPDGAIHLVNFAALPMRDGTFLAQASVLVHYLSTERDLTGNDSHAARQRLLLVGGATARAASSSPLSDAGNDCVALAGMKFPPLPGSLREIRSIASIWQSARATAGAPVIELAEGLATEDKFKSQAADSTIVHLATHGFFTANQCLSDQAGASPLRMAGLLLSPGKRGSADDGFLLAEEVATMDFTRARWIVLSGCDTGIGQIQVAEGILGLQRAFRVAGADTLVMSLWAAEDSATEAFMSTLYRARLEGRSSTADAMRAAYRASLAAAERARGYADPRYWAPFVASGAWQ